MSKRDLIFVGHCIVGLLALLVGAFAYARHSYLLAGINAFLVAANVYGAYRILNLPEPGRK